MLHSNEPMSMQNKVIIGAILVLLFILGVLVTYKILSSKEAAPVVTTEEKPLFGTGAQDVLLGTATSTDEETNVLLSGGPATELTTTTVNPGESATITWSSPDAVSCVASGDDKTWFFTGGSPVGSFETPPITKETIYAISCIDALGNATRKTVLVKPLTTLARVTNFFSGGSSGTGTSAGSTGAPTTPRYSSTYSGSITSTSRSSTGLTISLSASKTRITQGESLVLTWSFSGGGSCVASGAWTGTKTTSGSETIASFPVGYNSYSIACTGTSGETRSKLLRITAVAPTPTITSVTAEPSQVSSNEKSTIKWTSVNTTSCKTGLGLWAEPLINLPSNGSLATAVLTNTSTTQPLKQLTFEIICAGPSNTVKKTVIVKVASLDLPRIILTANPREVRIDQTNKTTLTWSATKATSCTAEGEWSGTKSLSGNEIVNITHAGFPDFRLSCTGPGGTNEVKATVTAYQPPPVISMSVDGAAGRCNGIYYAATLQPLRISWNTNQQALCKTSGGADGSGWNDASVSGSGSKTIIFTAGWNDTFSISCTSGGGEASNSVSVRNFARYATDCLSDALGF